VPDQITAELFRRPDPVILNATIPVFFVGRNTDGLWVARDADASSGGLFLLKSSAVRFARHARLPFAPTIITLADRVELDIANSGNRHAARFATAGRGLLRAAQALTGWVLKPLRTIFGALAEHRIHQAAARLASRRRSKRQHTTFNFPLD
jgi:hypothetical protein